MHILCAIKNIPNLQKFDDSIHNIFNVIFKMNLSSREKQILALPIRLSGLGIPKALEIHIAAFAGGLWSNGKAVYDKFFKDHGLSWNEWVQYINAQVDINDLKNYIKDGEINSFKNTSSLLLNKPKFSKKKKKDKHPSPNVNPIPSKKKEDGPSNYQNLLTSGLYERQHASLPLSFARPQENSDLARLIACSGRRSHNHYHGEWLSLPSSNIDFSFIPSNIFRMLMYLRLGHDLFPVNHAGDLSKCTSCDKMVMDSKGFHSLHCSAGATNAHVRHDNIVWLLYYTCIRANLSCVREDDALCVGFSADLHVRRVDEDNKNMVLDVTIPNPTANSNIDTLLNPSQGVSKVLKNSVDGKLKDPAGVAFAAVPRTSFYPFVIDAFGNAHENVYNIIDLISKQSASRTGYPLTSCIDRLTRKIFCQLWYYNARMLWHRYRLDDSED